MNPEVGLTPEDLFPEAAQDHGEAPVHSDLLKTVFLQVHQANAALAAIQARFDLEPAIGGVLRLFTGGPAPAEPPTGAAEVMLFTASLCLSRLADITEWYALTMLGRILEVDLRLALKLKDGKLSFRAVADHIGSLEDMHGHLRSHVRHHLETKGMEEILMFFEHQVGIPLFSERTVNLARLMITMRHLQVHNNGCWDHKAVQQVTAQGFAAKVGESLEIFPEMVAMMSLIVLANLEAVDRKVISMFGLTATVNTQELLHLQDRYAQLGAWYRKAEGTPT